MFAPNPPSTRRSFARILSQVGILALLMVISLSLYLVVLKWRGPRASLDTQTSWDKRIPFYPEWVWAYLIPYLVGPVVVALLNWHTFVWYLRRGLLIVLVTLVIFMVFPTQTVRPDGTGLGDGPTARLYRNMVAIDDPPANAAPSLHVSLTCLLALALIRDFPRWWLIAFGGAAVVWLATLFTWQHHLIDVATGILLAGLFALPVPWKRNCPGR
jgi:hypothetical protein